MVTDSPRGRPVVVPWPGPDALRSGMAAPLEGRRADAGTVRLSGRDVAGLVWCASYMRGGGGRVWRRRAGWGRGRGGAG